MTSKTAALFARWAWAKIRITKISAEVIVWIESSLRIQTVNNCTPKLPIKNKINAAAKRKSGLIIFPQYFIQ